MRRAGHDLEQLVTPWAVAGEKSCADAIPMTHGRGRIRRRSGRSGAHQPPAPALALSPALLLALLRGAVPGSGLPLPPGPRALLATLATVAAQAVRRQVPRLAPLEQAEPPPSPLVPRRLTSSGGRRMWSWAHGSDLSLLGQALVGERELPSRALTSRPYSSSVLSGGDQLARGWSFLASTPWLPREGWSDSPEHTPVISREC